jgi:hypothetical protein
VPPTGTWGSDGDSGINRVLHSQRFSHRSCSKAEQTKTQKKTGSGLRAGEQPAARLAHAGASRDHRNEASYLRIFFETQM